jgi:hypothetical protein
MSSPGLPGDGKPVPALLSSGTARSIRDALIDAERAEFERRFAEEMASAAQTLDLTGVLQVLSTFRKIAEVTQRQGAAAHRRMLDQVARLQRGDDVPAVPGHIHKAEINARLGL